MNRARVWLLGLLALTGMAVIVASLIYSAHSRAPGAAESHRAAATSPAAKAASQELERRRMAWARRPPSQGENTMNAERIRRIEMSRLELVSLAYEAAWIDMGLGEAEKAQLRQIFTQFRDASLLAVEKSALQPADKAGDSARPVDTAAADSKMSFRAFAKRMKDVLGEKRFAECERLYEDERSKLIKERVAFRRAGQAPTDGEP